MAPSHPSGSANFSSLGEGTTWTAAVMAYATSTQKRVWTFDAAALGAAHRERHARALKFVESAAAPPAVAGQKRPRGADGGAGEVSDAKRSKSAGGVAASGGGGGAYLTLAEEGSVLAWAQVELLRQAREAGLDRAITSASASFLLRFYVRSLLLQYPPAEAIPAALFLGIKAEACPYTEVDGLTRRLSVYDADLRERVHALVGGEGEGGEEEEEGEPWHLAMEAPLLSGLSYQLTVHSPYAPLKAMLVDCVEDYAALAAQVRGAGAGAGAGAGEGDVPAGAGGDPGRQRFTVSAEGQTLLRLTDSSFVPAWDAIQERAFEWADAAFLGDAPLLFTPAHIAAAALILASRRNQVRDSPPILPAPGSEALAGPAGVHRAGAGHATSTLLPALAKAPPPAVQWWIEPWVTAYLSSPPPNSSTSASDARARVQACIDRLVHGVVGMRDALASGPALMARLETARDASLVPGSAAHEARLVALRAARAAYKRGKAARGAAARGAFEAGVLAERAAGGLGAPTLVPREG